MKRTVIGILTLTMIVMGLTIMGCEDSSNPVVVDDCADGSCLNAPNAPADPDECIDGSCNVVPPGTDPNDPSLSDVPPNDGITTDLDGKIMKTCYDITAEKISALSAAGVDTIKVIGKLPYYIRAMATDQFSVFNALDGGKSLYVGKADGEITSLDEIQVELADFPADFDSSTFGSSCFLTEAPIVVQDPPTEGSGETPETPADPANPAGETPAGAVANDVGQDYLNCYGLSEECYYRDAHAPESVLYNDDYFVVYEQQNKFVHIRKSIADNPSPIKYKDKLDVCPNFILSRAGCYWYARPIIEGFAPFDPNELRAIAILRDMLSHRPTLRTGNAFTESSSGITSTINIRGSDLINPGINLGTGMGFNKTKFKKFPAIR